MATTQVRMSIVYEQGEDGWIIASVTDVPGTHSQGRTREEARANVVDALVLMLAPDDDASDGDREWVPDPWRRSQSTADTQGSGDERSPHRPRAAAGDSA